MVQGQEGISALVLICGCRTSNRGFPYSGRAERRGLDAPGLQLVRARGREVDHAQAGLAEETV